MITNQIVNFSGIIEDEVKVKLMNSIANAVQNKYGKIYKGIEVTKEIIDKDTYLVSLNSDVYDFAFNIIFNFSQGRVTIQDYSFAGTEGNDLDQIQSVTSNNYSSKIMFNLETFMRSHFKELKDYKDFLRGKKKVSKFKGLPESEDEMEFDRPERLISMASKWLSEPQAPESFLDYAKSLGIEYQQLMKIMIPRVTEIIKEIEKKGLEVTKDRVVMKIKKETEKNLWDFMVALSPNAFDKLIKVIKD